MVDTSTATRHDTRVVLREPTTPAARAAHAARVEALHRAELGRTLAGLPSVLVDLQVRARDHGHRAQHPGATDLVVEHGGRAVGRLLLAVDAHEVRVVDLVVDAAVRRRGIAAAVLRECCALAGSCDLPLTLRVDPANTAALRLYERAGLVRDHEDATVVHLTREPLRVRA